MKAAIKIFCAIALVSLLSCQKEEPVKGADWGYTEYYESSIFKKYNPVRMEKTLRFDLNNDADTLLRGDRALTFYLSSDKKSLKPLKGVKVFVDGKPCKDGIITINSATADEQKAQPSVVRIKLGLEFTGEATDGKHTLYLINGKVQNSERFIQYRNDIEVVMGILDDGILIEKKTIANPGNVIASWTLIIVLALLLVWIVFLRPILFTRISIAKLQIQGPGAFMGMFPIKGCIKVVLTSKKMKQSFLHHLFVGKIKYITSDVVPLPDVTFEPRDRKSLRIRTKDDFSCDATILEKHNTYKLTNMKTKEQATISLQ